MEAESGLDDAKQASKNSSKKQRGKWVDHRATSSLSQVVYLDITLFFLLSKFRLSIPSGSSAFFLILGHSLQRPDGDDLLQWHLVQLGLIFEDSMLS